METDVVRLILAEYLVCSLNFVGEASCQREDSKDLDREHTKPSAMATPKTDEELLSCVVMVDDEREERAGCTEQGRRAGGFNDCNVSAERQEEWSHVP